jgi:two-component SAPR family response regulator
VELYSGEFLPGFYEDWVITERERVSTMFLEALCCLAASFEQTGNIGRAIEYARRAVSADSLREEAHVELMRL